MCEALCDRLLWCSMRLLGSGLLRMREGIYWRGSNQVRRRQQGCNPDQSFVLRSGSQAFGIGASIIVGCFILCFVTWILSRFRSPPHQAPAQAVVFELYWYHGHSLARNETFSALAGPVLQGKRGLLKYPGATESTRQEIFDKGEQEEYPLDDEGSGDNLSLEFDLLKKRKGCNKDSDSMTSSRGATHGALKIWPVFGGHRQHDQAIESLYTKIVLGNPGTGRMREYIMHIDTGSGQTWVNCIGSPVVGPAGLFEPTADSYLNCETSRDMCTNFQEGANSEQPCDSEHDFKCLYEYAYADGTLTKGSVINAEISFDMNDGSSARHIIAIGCATEGKGANILSDDEDDDDDDDDEEDPRLPSLKDGILGIGRHPAGLLSQLYSLNLFSEYVTAMCLDHARPRGAIGRRGQSYPMEYTGFLSFGDLYTSQAATTVWTASILPSAARPQYVHFPQEQQIWDVEAMYMAPLMRVMYRDSSISFRSKKRKKDESVQVGGTHLGFDTGSDLTFLSPTLFNFIENTLDEDATRMGYKTCQDAPEYVRNGMSRKCWTDPTDLRKSLVQDFGELIMKFSSLANDDTTSDLVIKPEYYITADVQANGAALRTCFNMRKDDEYPNGNLGAEAMRGHLFIFNERPHQIGWSPVTSCRDLS